MRTNSFENKLIPLALDGLDYVDRFSRTRVGQCIFLGAIIALETATDVRAWWRDVRSDRPRNVVGPLD